MGRFICKKPVTLSGHPFTYGEEVPDGHILPSRVLALIRSGYIVEVGDPAAGDGKGREQPFQPCDGVAPIKLPIMTGTGVLEAVVEPQSIVIALTIMQKNVDEAGRDIAGIDDMDALLILDAVDSRKGIQKAAEERAVQLGAGKDAGSPDEDTGGQEWDGGH